MKLMIARHGETLENQKGIIQGHLPGTLSSDGIDQAEELGRRLKDEKIDIIFSSDLARAYDTARIISRYHLNVPIIKTDRLRERSFGLYEGKRKEDIKDLFERGNVESKESIMRRTGYFLEMIKREHSNNSLLTVAHGGSMIALIANSLNLSFDEVAGMGQIKNTAITIFNPYPVLETLNCYLHLN